MVRKIFLEKGLTSQGQATFKICIANLSNYFELTLSYIIILHGINYCQLFAFVDHATSRHFTEYHKEESSSHVARQKKKLPASKIIKTLKI